MNDDSNEPGSSRPPSCPDGDTENGPPASEQAGPEDLTLYAGDDSSGVTADNAPIYVPDDGETSSEGLSESEAGKPAESAATAGDELLAISESSGNGPSSMAEALADLEEPGVRTGSPFATDPLVPVQPHRIEVVIDGPLRYTASGSVAAAAMVLAFAGAAAWWFPSGGTMIAALGCVLSIFGLYSPQRVTSAGILSLHLGLFVLCYGRSISS